MLTIKDIDPNLKNLANSDPKIRETAVFNLRCIVQNYRKDNAATMLAEKGGIVPLVRLLTDFSMKTRLEVLELFRSFSSYNFHCDRLYNAIREAGGVTQFVGLLSDSNLDIVSKSMCTIRVVCGAKSTQDSVRNAGGIVALMNFVKGENQDLKTSAMWVLATLADNNNDNAAAMRQAGGLSILHRFLIGSEYGISHRAADLLRIVCISKTDQLKVVQQGGMTSLINLFWTYFDASMFHALDHFSANCEEGQAAILASGRWGELKKILDWNISNYYQLVKGNTQSKMMVKITSGCITHLRAVVDRCEAYQKKQHHVLRNVHFEKKTNAAELFEQRVGKIAATIAPSQAITEKPSALNEAIIGDNLRRFNALLVEVDYIDASLPTANKDTLLHSAVRYGRPEMVLTLLKRSASLSVLNQAKQTPLALARQHNQSLMVFILSRNGDYREALASINDRIQMLPAVHSLYVTRASIYYRLAVSGVSLSEQEQYINHAIADVNRVMQKAPSNDLVKRHTKLTHELTDIQEKQRHQVELASQEKQSHEVTKRTYLRKNWDTASAASTVAEYDRLIQASPHDAQNHAEQGLFYIHYAKKSNTQTQTINLLKRALISFKNAMNYDVFNHTFAENYEAVNKKLEQLDKPKPGVSAVGYMQDRPVDAATRKAIEERKAKILREQALQGQTIFKQSQPSSREDSTSRSKSRSRSRSSSGAPVLNQKK